MIRRYTLSRPELAYVRAHRGAQNRLGIAIQLSYLQHPGRVLAEDETPPPALLGIVGAQIRVSPALWGLYAGRDQTRREHQQEAMNRLGLSLFGARQYRDLREWLVPTAMQTTQGITLAEACIAEIRRRLFVVPPVGVIERLVSETATRAQRQIYQTLTDPLIDAQRAALDGLLELRGDAPHSTLAWLKFPAGLACINFRIVSGPHLDSRYQKTVEQNDANTMAEILPDEFVLVEGDGKQSTKADLVNDAKSGRREGAFMIAQFLR